MPEEAETDNRKVSNKTDSADGKATVTVPQGVSYYEFFLYALWKIGDQLAEEFRRKLSAPAALPPKKP